jgi:hypothetical protein
MPWTYYQADIVNNATGTAAEKVDAKRRLMWTSESKNSSASASDAGKYVSEIKRKTLLGGSYVDEVVKNPTLADYQNWGWPLKQDADKNPILPEYGEFAFRPGLAPSYEDASNINVTFKFGFGLNNTSYNFAEEQAQITVYNLSSAPKFYLTDNPMINPKFENGSWNTDMIEVDEDGNLKDNMSEGTNENDGNNPYYKYLMVRVEAGEHLRVVRTGNAKGHVKMTLGGHKNDSTNVISATKTDTQINDNVITLTAPHKKNVEGEAGVMVPAPIKYDFYRIQLELAQSSQTLAYLTNTVKQLNLSFTPVVYDDDLLDSFKTNVYLRLNVVKKVAFPFIRDDLTLETHGFEDVKYNAPFEQRDLSDQSNLRVRNIITADEAIHYAVTNNVGPAFCQNTTFASALNQYKRSILTETEKNLDDYKKSFTSEEMMKKFAYYIAIDMSAHALENFSKFDASENGLAGDLKDLSAAIDLSDLYNGGSRHSTYNFNTELTTFRDSTVGELTNNSKNITYANVLANTTTHSNLTALYKKMLETKIAPNTAATDRGSNYMDASGLPYMDTRINEPRHFGEIVDVSHGHWTDIGSTNKRYSDAHSKNRIRTSLMGHPSTLPALMFALYEHKRGESSASTKSFMANYEGIMDHNGGSTKIRQLVEAMRSEYKVNTEKDISGNSTHRPVGHSTELDDFRWEINPVNGELASQYLKKIMRIVDTNDGPDTVYYGADAARTAYNLSLDNPNTAEIEALLYNGSVGKKTIDTAGGLLKSDFAGRSFKISNPTLNNTTHGTATTNSSADFADRVLNTTDGFEFIVPTFGLNPYGNKDQSAVFYSHHHRVGSNGNNDGTNYELDRGYIGDCSGWYSSFIKKSSDKIASANQLMAGQWVYTSDYQTGTVHPRTGYTDATRHSENADFSGIIKFPRAKQGSYQDVYINGQELRETMIDVEHESTFYNLYRQAGSKALDMSGLPTYANNLIPQDVSEARVGVSFGSHAAAEADFKKLTTKLNIVTAGGYQFYRIGSVIRVLAEKENIDADQGLDGGLPEIVFKTRGDKLGACDKSYKLYVYPKDSSSAMSIAMNPSRMWGTGYDASGHAATGFNEDTSGVWSSRWSQANIPIDVSGMLEKGEKFKLDITNDTYQTSTSNFLAPSAGLQKNADDLNMGTFTSDFTGTKHDIADQFANLGYKVQYQNAGSSEWLDADGKEFEYFCHNKDTMPADRAAALTSRYNTAGAKDDNSLENDTAVYANSSNVKGMPKFRVVLPSQAQLLQVYKQTSGSGGNNNAADRNFGSIGRQCKVRISFTHAISKEEYNIDNYVRTYVSSDAFDANVHLRELRYKASDKPENAKASPQTMYKFKGTTASGANAYLPGLTTDSLPVVYYNTHDNIIGRGDQPFADGDPNKKLISNVGFRQSWYTLTGETARDISGVELQVPEGIFGPNQPIAEIRFDNYINNDGQFGAQANIVPLFKKESDYREYEIYGTYTNVNNGTGVAATDDANASAPDVIPPNTNYEIKLSTNGTKAFLYRKTPFNYEEWVGGSNDLYSKNSFFGANGAYHELVTVRVKYETPDSEGIINQQRTQDKTINFYVKPIDRVELEWKDNFKVFVDEGAKSVDVTSILSAKMHGMESADIKYFLAGYVDESGLVYVHNETSSAGNADPFVRKLAGYTDMSANFDLSNVRDLNTKAANSGAASGGITGLVLKPNSAKDILNLDYAALDLKEQTVGGSLNFYHKNHLQTSTVSDNKHFDAYEKKNYRIIVGAMLDQNDQSGTERKLAMLNIEVRNSSTGFYIKEDKSSIIKVLETLGTVAEGKSAKQNNPEIKIGDQLLANIGHEDLNNLQVYDPKIVTYKVQSVDPALVVCPPDNNSAESVDFSNQVIKLRDNDTNKTTETKIGGASTKLARHAHYNYERQRSYRINLVAELSNYTEIEVVKVAEDYICGTTDSRNDTFNRLSANSKTAKYIMTSSKSDGKPQKDPLLDVTTGQDRQSRYYYFKDPETNKYHGPLSAQPESFEQLNAFSSYFFENFNVKVSEAYVRYETRSTAANKLTYTPLYKMSNFTISDKPPKPDDIAVLPFEIQVINTFDKEKTSPQPYTIDAGVSYSVADPANQTLLDAGDISVQKGSKHVCYVYGDHQELNTNNNKDHANDALIPGWHPHNLLPSHTDYTNGFKSNYGENKLGNGTERKVHPKAKALLANESTQRVGVTDGKANNSLRYGRFKEINAKNGVFLDFFVEHHGKIDASGWNETGEHVFGEAVDYSGTQKTLQYANSLTTGIATLTETAESDKRIYRLANMSRHNQHLATDVSDSYYSTGEVAFKAGKSAEAGKTYQFTVVGVTNKLATQHDLSYNKNMVDWNNNFYPSLKDVANKSTNDSTKVSLPQPFQKYVYDPSGQRVITYGYAANNLGERSATSEDAPNLFNAYGSGDKSVDSSGLNGAIVRRFSAAGSVVSTNTYSTAKSIPNADASGSLFCCRTHFTVICPKDGNAVAVSSKNMATEDSGKMVFNTSNVIQASLNNGVYTPHMNVTAAPGQIMIFEANGSRAMVYYNEQTREWRAI